MGYIILRQNLKSIPPPSVLYFMTAPLIAAYIYNWIVFSRSLRINHCFREMKGRCSFAPNQKVACSSCSLQNWTIIPSLCMIPKGSCVPYSLDIYSEVNPLDEGGITTKAKNQRYTNTNWNLLELSGSHKQSKFICKVKQITRSCMDC